MVLDFRVKVGIIKTMSGGIFEFLRENPQAALVIGFCFAVIGFLLHKLLKQEIKLLKKDINGLSKEVELKFDVLKEGQQKIELLLSNHITETNNEIKNLNSEMKEVKIVLAEIKAAVKK